MTTFFGLVEQPAHIGQKPEAHTFAFGLIAYAEAGSYINSFPIQVFHETGRQIQQLEALQSGSIVQFRAERNDRFQAGILILEEILDTDAQHDALAAIFVARSEQLGSFRYNDVMGYFSAEVPWGDDSILFNLAGEKDQFAAMEAQALRLLSKQAEWQQKFEEILLDEVYFIATEEEEDMEEDEFLETVRLVSIEIQADGTFEVSYDDDDLMGGHGIQIPGNIDDDCLGSTFMSG
ncbi:MAG: DUF2262 domain-containing protein [Bacteroidota bacterium]